MTSPSPTLPPLLWCDWETTGLPQDPDTIPLEWACWVTGPTAVGYHSCNGEPWTTLIAPPDGGTNPLDWPEAVRKMHADSGLLGEWVMGARSAPTLAEVDEAVKHYLNRTVGFGTKVALAGTGVGHAELAVWVPRWLPQLAARCTYWAMDVSPWRRLATQAGLIGRTEPAHRALADVASAVNVHRLMFETIKQAVEAGKRDVEIPSATEFSLVHAPAPHS